MKYPIILTFSTTEITKWGNKEYKLIGETKEYLSILEVFGVNVKGEKTTTFCMWEKDVTNNDILIIKKKEGEKTVEKSV